MVWAQRFAPLRTAVVRLMSCPGIDNGVYCKFNDLVEELLNGTELISSERPIDFNVSMLVAAFKNLGGNEASGVARVKFTVPFNDLHIEDIKGYLYVDLEDEKVCKVNTRSVKYAEGVYIPSVNSISGTDSSAVPCMKKYLVDNGRISFTEAVSLDVYDILKYLKREKSEHNKKLARQQKRDEAAKSNEDNIIRRAKQKRINNMERRKSDDSTESSNLGDLSNVQSESSNVDYTVDDTESDRKTEESSPIRKRKKISKLSVKERRKLVRDIAAAEAEFHSQVDERVAKLETINTLTADIKKLHISINSYAKELQLMKKRLAASDDDDQIDDTEITSYPAPTTIVDDNVPGDNGVSSSSRESTSTPTPSSNIQLHIIANGIATSQYELPRDDAVIFVDRLNIPTEDRGKNDRGYETFESGRQVCLIPKGAAIVEKRILAELEEWAVVVDKLYKLFDGKRRRLNPEALRILASFNLHNYGGSDEATEMIIAGTLKAFFHEIGFNITSSQLSKGCPSRDTIKRAELNLAVDVVIQVLNEIKDNDVQCISIMVDHGHRAGQDHLVIIIVYPGVDSNGRRTLKFFCPSIDSAGHESAETADAVKNVIDRLFMAMDIKVIAATADAGGGGSIDNIRPELIRLGIMDKNGKFTNCVQHSFNKAIEIPIKETMGGEGLGVRSPTQMVFVFSTLMDHLLRSKGGRDTLNRLWKIVGEEILIRPEWRQYAEYNFPLIWSEFVEKVDKLELDDNDLENLFNFLTEAPSNIQRPVWTRWQTMISTTDIFLVHYVQIYFLCIAVKTDAKNESYAWKLASTLLSLMNEKAEPTLVENNRENINEYVNSFSNDNVDERRGFGDPNFNEGVSPPSFHTMLLFFSGFCKYTFTDHFELLKKNDPYFGDGTFGQISRFMSLVAYCVDNDMNKLKSDNGTGWMSMNEFQPYLTAIRNVPAVTTHAANRAFYDSLPMIFFNKYHNILNKHFITRWTGGELGIYTIAGDSWLAQELAYALVTYKGYLQNLNKEDSATLKYSFLDKNIQLDDFFRRKGTVQTVNIKDFMEFFLDRTDIYEILTDAFTVDNWDSIEALAIARDRDYGNTVVRLFDYMSDGDIDRSTWGDYDY